MWSGPLQTVMSKLSSDFQTRWSVLLICRSRKLLTNRCNPTWWRSITRCTSGLRKSSWDVRFGRGRHGECETEKNERARKTAGWWSRVQEISCMFSFVKTCMSEASGRRIQIDSKLCLKIPGHTACCCLVTYSCLVTFFVFSWFINSGLKPNSHGHQVPSRIQGIAIPHFIPEGRLQSRARPTERIYGTHKSVRLGPSPG